MTIQRGRGRRRSTCRRSTSRRWRKRFKKSKHKNTDLEVLKAAIRAQLEKLIRLNRTRADFAEKFEALIESYNAGSRNIEELFEELVKLSQQPDRGAGTPRPREHERGGAGHLRHPHPARLPS